MKISKQKGKEFGEKSVSFLRSLFFDENDSPEVKTTKVISYTVLTVIAVCILLSSILFSVLFEEKETISVPNVTGMPLDEATETLQNHFLRVKINRINTEDPADKGIVVSQTKTPGSVVKVDYTVVLNVSKGPVLDKIVDFSGWEINETAAYIKAYQSGLTLQYPLSFVVSDRPRGTVLGQDPPAGTEIYGETPLRLFVSGGNNLYRVQSEDYIGTSFRETMLSLAGRNVFFRFTADQSEKKGTPFTISSQSVEAGRSISVFDGYVFNVIPPTYASADRVFGLVRTTVEQPQVPVLLRVTRTPVNRKEEDYFSMQFMNSEISFPFYDEPGVVYSVYLDEAPVFIYQVAK
ncbi:MAG: PASTA domain-containing protein [Spirochaetia bacterium]|nr:PASTA domain-containing protein [Spirochaetia bacterium]